MTPYIKTYTKDPSGLGYGDYTQVYAQGLKVNIEHSVLQGDQMTFQTVSKVADNNLDFKRPIRFYTGDDTKLFDGLITDIDYELLGNDYKKLTGTASGWWQELKSMDLVHEMVYDNESPNDMLASLCQIANNFGVMKKALYKYDTDKIPHYSTFSSDYTTPSGTELVVNNIYQGIQDVVSFLDIAELYSPYDFGLRIEALPAASGESWALSETEVNTGIYIIPYLMREDVDSEEIYSKFKLEAGFDVRKDYRNICNNCIAVGESYHTQQLRSVFVLNSIPITSNNQQFVKDNPVLRSHYLAVTMDNTTAFDISGYIQVTRVRYSDSSNPSETFPMTVAAGEVATHFTSERTEDGLPGIHPFLQCVGFNGCHVSVREVTNDTPYPIHTTIGGRSINEIGYAAKRIENMMISTQAQADAIAGKMVRLYHNPVYTADATILDSYVTFDNNIGKLVDIYSQFDDYELPFVLMSSNWEFSGESVTQHIAGVLHATHWDDDERFTFVIDSALDDVVTSTGALIVV